MPWCYIHTAPTDYGAINTSVTLSATQRTATVFVTIIDDEAVELNERFFMKIEVSGEMSDAVELEQGETQVIITNNDGNVVEWFIVHAQHTKPQLNQNVWCNASAKLVLQQWGWFNNLLL